MPITAFIINRTNYRLNPVSYSLKNYRMEEEPVSIPPRSGAMLAFKLAGPDMEHLNFLIVDCVRYALGFKKSDPTKSGPVVHFRFQMKPAETFGGSLILASHVVTEDRLQSSPISYSEHYPHYRVGFMIG